jgi:hypothetical protein
VGETYPIFCEQPESRDLIRAEWREYIRGDVFTDPMGKPYQPFKEEAAKKPSRK